MQILKSDKATGDFIRAVITKRYGEDVWSFLNRKEYSGDRLFLLGMVESYRSLLKRTSETSIGDGGATSSREGDGGGPGPVLDGGDGGGVGNPPKLLTRKK